MPCDTNLFDLPEVLSLAVFVPLISKLACLGRNTGQDVDPPAAAISIPHSLLRPYLSVPIVVVRSILPRTKAMQPFSLDFINTLDSVISVCIQAANNAALIHRPKQNISEPYSRK